MAESVKVKVRPGRSLQFPAICVHCSRPAKDRMLVARRVGRVTRMIDVPLCAECHRQLNRQSAEEERMQKVGQLVSWLAAAAAVLLLTFLLPASIALPIRIAAGAVGAILVFKAVQITFRRRSFEAALPEKKAVLASAAIEAFSWRATTFVFNNQTFAEQFKELNKTQLMES